MQRPLVGQHRISHESLVFSRFTHKLFGESVYQENTSDKWDVPRYPTRERCITILYHAIEDTNYNTINATYARRMVGRLDVIPSNIQRIPVL